MYEYTLGTEKLIRVDSEKDVGVVTSAELSWELQVISCLGVSGKFKYWCFCTRHYLVT